MRTVRCSPTATPLRTEVWLPASHSVGSTRRARSSPPPTTGATGWPTRWATCSPSETRRTTGACRARNSTGRSWRRQGSDARRAAQDVPWSLAFELRWPMWLAISTSSSLTDRFGVGRVTSCVTPFGGGPRRRGGGEDLVEEFDQVEDAHELDGTLAFRRSQPWIGSVPLWSSISTWRRPWPGILP